MNRRRQIVLGLGSALAGTAAPIGAQSTAGSVRRVGALTLNSRSQAIQSAKPFYEEMARLGWVEGRTVVYDWSAADGRSAMLPQVAAELVARAPHLIVAGGLIAALAAKQATKTIPVVFWGIATPVEEGLVASLAHPGGNVTGISPTLERMLPKRVQLLRDILPKLKRVGVIRPPVDPVLDKTLAELEPALSPLGVTIVGADVADAAGLEFAVSRLADARVDVIVDALTSGIPGVTYDRIVALTNRARLPYVASWEAGPDAGALFSYGGSTEGTRRALARLLDRILRGANPADIPVESVDQLDFVVNLKTARLFGITIPHSVLLRATRVIE